MNIPAFKDKILDSLDLWLEERIDDMIKDNKSLAIPSVYLKRGYHNIINKYEGKISEGIDNAALFLTDENGNIDAKTIFEDIMKIFSSMEETSFDIGIIKGMVGKGKVSLTLPDNILTNIVFGSNKAITFNEDDFLELKDLLLEEQ